MASQDFLTTKAQNPGPEANRMSTSTTVRDSSVDFTKEASSQMGGSKTKGTPPNDQKHTEDVTKLEDLKGDSPKLIDCPFCNKRTTTTIQKTGRVRQFLLRATTGILSMILLLNPYGMMGWCMNIHYSCSECNNKVAIRSSKGTIEVFRPGQSATVLRKV
ncbi:uncharacterized protein CTRU02_202401 [Colletotrichum truncatum]|uniref:Uncharacterized protein n=1 Tax=Colletotrichum truncatum TaxID=5467 RepID=A0ACC3ZK76_COLTU